MSYKPKRSCSSRGGGVLFNTYKGIKSTVKFLTPDLSKSVFSIVFDEELAKHILFETQGKSIVNVYEKTKSLGKGTFGSVDQFVTDDKKYAVAVKFFEYKDDEEIQIVRDIRKKKKICDFVPATNVYDSKGKIVPVIVMALAKPLDDLGLYFLPSSINPLKTKTEKLKLFTEVYYEITRMCSCLTSINAAYTDLKAGNLLYTVSDEGKIKIMFGDLGSVLFFKDNLYRSRETFYTGTYNTYEHSIIFHLKSLGELNEEKVLVDGRVMTLASTVTMLSLLNEFKFISYFHWSQFYKSFEKAVTALELILSAPENDFLSAPVKKIMKSTVKRKHADTPYVTDIAAELKPLVIKQKFIAKKLPEKMVAFEQLSLPYLSIVGAPSPIPKVKPSNDVTAKLEKIKQKYRKMRQELDAIMN